MCDDDVFHLRIKSFKDVEIAVPSGSVVAHVKQQVRAALGVTESDEERYLRLICKGRLLLPDDHPITDFNVQNGDVVHAVLAPTGKNANTNSSSAASGTQNSRRRRLRTGTVVGPGGRVTRATNAGIGSSGDDSSSEEEEDEETGIVRERRGFDRLRASGLTRSEVTAIRAYFSRHVDRHMTQYPNAHDDETDALRRRHLYEEDWMAVQGPASEFRLNLNQNTLMRYAALSRGSGGGVTWTTTSRGAPNGTAVGTDWDFVWGFMLGYFVGSIILIWVWRPNITHRQKIGILTGISFKLLMTVLGQQQIEEEQYNAANGNSHNVHQPAVSYQDDDDDY